MTFKIGHFPTHVNKFVEHNQHAAKNQDCKSSGFTEMDPGTGTHIPEMEKIWGPDYVIATDLGENLGPHSQEVPIVAQKSGMKPLPSKVVQLHASLPGGGVGQDRYLTIQPFVGRVFKRRKWVDMQTHLMAAIQGSNGALHWGDPEAQYRIRANIEAMQKIEAEIRQYIALGYEVTIKGDFNWFDSKHHPWRYSPKAMAERLNMKFVTSKLDWVMWTNGLQKIDQHIFPMHGQIDKADHDWIIVTLRWVKGWWK